MEGGAGYALMRLLGVFRPAGPRLAGIVNEVSAALGCPVRQTWEFTSPDANAMAVPTRGDLIFTTGLLDAAPDEELKAVAAHEIGHLTESPWIRRTRVVGAFLISGLIFTAPIEAAFGLEGVFALGAVLYAAWKGLHWFSREMEHRADQVAAAAPSGNVIYAQAIERIYRLNLYPAVQSGTGQTHPHLYDRLLAAKYTPDYSRPRPPSGRPMSIPIFLVAVVVLAGVWSGLH